MSNKKIQVSDVGANSWYTLPGNQGEFHSDMANTDDTVYGQAEQSQQPTLGMWNITSNGIFKNVPGYQISIKRGGVATTMTAEATTSIGGQKYQITNATKRHISYTNSVTVLDNAVDHTADVKSIDYLTGIITFATGYTVTGPVTVTGKYIPMGLIAKGRRFTLTQTCPDQDITGYEDAQTNNGYRKYDQGLKTRSLEVGGIFATSNTFYTDQVARGIVQVEIDIDLTNPGTSVYRGFHKLGAISQAGNQGDIETATIALPPYVPDGDLVANTFSWTFTGSALNLAIRKTLAAWAGDTDIDVQYLSDGTTTTGAGGVKGTCQVAECTLTNTIEGLNEFSFNYRGNTAAPTFL